VVILFDDRCPHVLPERSVDVGGASEMRRGEGNKRVGRAIDDQGAK